MRSVIHAHHHTTPGSSPELSNGSSTTHVSPWQPPCLLQCGLYGPMSEAQSSWLSSTVLDSGTPFMLFCN